VMLLPWFNNRSPHLPLPPPAGGRGSG
jgi:hypothetical protein